MAFKNKTGNTPISDADFTDEELDLIYGIDRNGVPGEETRKPAKRGCRNDGKHKKGTKKT